MKGKLAISVLALGAVVIHVLLPAVRIDVTTTILFGIAVLPWLGNVLKSLELPGGFKIELRDVQQATRRVTDTIEGEVSGDHPLLTPPEAGDPTLGFEFRLLELSSLVDQDPNLGLVAFRIELERMLSNIARGHNLKPQHVAAGRLVHELRQAEILPSRVLEGISALIRYGNLAAHGAEVEPAAARWVRDEAPAILNALTDYLGD